MDVNMMNTVSQIIEIEDDVIDLDAADKTPEEVICEWDAKIRKKMSMFAVVDNENTLGDLMKQYLESLQEVASSYEDSETLKHKVFCHISFLYSYYIELQCCASDSYLNNMEDILTLYCNLELNIIQPLKKKDLSKDKYKKRIVSATRRIIRVLTVYLLEHHDHILHVLIKMNTTNKVSDPCSEVLNVLYSHFLTKVPALNLCDESFCRTYVAFQKWKEIRNTEDWAEMDKIMYKMFKRTPESIKNNEMLRQILMPICHEEVDIISNVFCSYRAILEAYFKHIMAKTNIEIDDLEFNIDLGEDEPTISVNNENEEEVQFLKLFYEVERNMSNLSNITNVSEVNIFTKCKEELDDDDDDVLFVDTLLQSQAVLEFQFDNDKSDDHRMSNEDLAETERIFLPNPSILENFANENNSELKTVSRVNKTCGGTTKTVLETCDSCQATEVQKMEKLPEQRLCLINNTTSYSVVTEINKPKVSFASNNIQVSSPSKSTNALNTPCDGTPNAETIGMKNGEVQADDVQNFVYNDYGLTTPPFDVPMDDVHPRSIEPRLYANISHHHRNDLTLERENTCNKNMDTTRAVKVQMDLSASHKNCSYNDYGLTPPNDIHVEDLSTRLQEKRVYTNIGQEDLLNGRIEKNFSDCEQVNTHDSEMLQKVHETRELNTKNHQFSDVRLSSAQQVTDNSEETTSNVQYIMGQNSEYDEFEDHLGTSEIVNIAPECDNENMNSDSCSYGHKQSHLLHDKSNNHSEVLNVTFENFDLHEPLDLKSHSVFKRSDQIDTGQFASFIENINPVIITKDKSLENYNGNIFLKSSVSSNRTNGQTHDISNSTSTKIIPTIIENYHNFNKTQSDTVSESVLTKHNSFPYVACVTEFKSKSNNEFEDSRFMENKVYKTLKNNTKKNHLIKKNVTFASSAHTKLGKERSQAHRVRKQTSIQREVKNNVSFVSGMHKYEEERPSERVSKTKQILKNVEVALERNLYLEETVKRMTNGAQQTIRVDYDKTTTNQLNKNDTVRTGGENPKLTFIVNCKPGSLTVRNRIHLEKKPKKRKVEPQTDSVEDPAIRKRAFRTSKKKAIATKGERAVQRTRSCSSENNFVSKSVSEFDKLLNSGAYSNKPFRLDLTS